MIELLQRFNFAAGYAACAKTCRVLLEMGSIDFHVYSVGWDASKIYVFLKQEHYGEEEE